MSKEPYRTTFHRDGSVTVWDVISQDWERTSKPSDAILASLNSRERVRVVLHTRKIRLGKSWSIHKTSGYRPIDAERQNPCAHGGVTHLELRVRDGELEARHVNSNGRHQEFGRVFVPDFSQL